MDHIKYYINCIKNYINDTKNYLEDKIKNYSEVIKNYLEDKIDNYIDVIKNCLDDNKIKIYTENNKIKVHIQDTALIIENIKAYIESIKSYIEDFINSNFDAPLITYFPPLDFLVFIIGLSIYYHLIYVNDTWCWGCTHPDAFEHHIGYYLTCRRLYRGWRDYLYECLYSVIDSIVYVYNFYDNIFLPTINNFSNLILDTPLFFWFGSFFLLTIIFSFLFISYLGLYGVFFLNLISLFLFWLSLLFYIKPIFIDQIVYNVYLCKWFYINYNVKVNFNFLIDTISFSFILLTTTIGLFVYIYAFSYFRYEPLVDRFILFLCSFIISMIFLVSSGNLIMLFLGWELIGLTSFFLINFWVSRVGTLKAAFKAFSFNKVSDFFILMFIIVIYNFIYDFEIQSINSQIHLYYNYKISILNININLIELLSFIILSAAFIKSAQFGAHIWLPDSMEAPVPASSLIHSATLVSAGIFLILRFYPIFEYSFYSFFILPVIGSLTAAYGGLVASFQSDTKRILAYSTISHCGFLMILCSFNLNEFVILYLYVHGFFKAAVFMCIGNVIRISKNYQDFRRMGFYYKYLPFECFCAFICLLNLSGLPFTLGFSIKHLLFLGVNNNVYLYYFVIFNSLIGAIAGLFYSHRLFYYVFFDFKKGKKNIYRYLNRNNLYSVYYSNTSLASNFSILSLLIVSYAISLYIYVNFFSINFNFSDYFNSLNYSNYYNLYTSYNGFLFNLSYLNWIVILLITGFIYISWRVCHNNYIIIDNFVRLTLFSIFFFLNYQFVF